MREILFRGKSKEIGYWVEGNYCFCCVPLMGIMDIPSIQTVSGDDFRYIAVFPETVGQFTGLTDRNGIKIFEGDIIKSCEYDDIYAVKYFSYNNYPAFDCVPEVSNCECNGLSFLVNVEGCEVIGNIFDNPELIKEG